MKTYFAVWENTDKTEGRGPSKITAIFQRQLDAQRIADQHEPYGFSGQFNHITPIEIYDNIQEYHDATKSQLIKDALKKLTKQEREALGV